MALCQIKWIDKDGRETSDLRPSMGLVHLPRRVLQIAGRGVQFEASPHYHICAEHAKRLSDPGMELWQFEPLPQS